MGNLKIVGTDELVETRLTESDSTTSIEAGLTVDKDTFNRSLSGHIQRQFQFNKDAREEAGIEDDILNSTRAYNAKYSPKDLTRIKSGSKIFVNLTATRCRVACSWIRDILQSAKFKPYSLSPTTKPDIPATAKRVIEEALDKEFGMLLEEATEEQTTETAQASIRELNKNKRDYADAIAEDINEQAKYELKKIERKVDDELEAGGWDTALSQFIEDFTILPTAFMKGPVITKRKALTWVNGKPVEQYKYVYVNKRISPLDMYPSPNATAINDGNLIEHIRLSRGELDNLRDLDAYDSEAIERVLTDATPLSSTSSYLFNSAVENEKAEEEKRGTDNKANTDVLHGLHYFGSAPAKVLKEWGMTDEELGSAGDTKEIEIEAIWVEGEVVKCIINDDPLLRRPYYKASWQNIPGSFWGRSLPSIMESEQRMCNATARSLSNNMGISSGPQMEVYIDRLADAGDITEVYPMKIWQVMSDPTGAGGRAVQWFQPPSNAKELLAVFQDFEKKADDAIGIPKYAHGNEQLGQAAQTATGLSMLLESSSKSIKDAIRNIDYGLIKPRIEYQFYWHMLNDDEDTYTGDIDVVVTGSSTITIHGAEQLRRNEFLQITANEIDQGIIGVEGRAVILREVSKDLNLPDNAVPTPLELKKKEKEKEAMQAQAAEQEKAELEKSLAATRLQVDGQKEMHQGTLQVKAIELELKKQKQDIETQLKALELQSKNDVEIRKDQTKKEEAAIKDLSNKREAAIKLRTGEGF